MRLHCFFGVYVIVTCEPSWLVSSNRDKREINAREPATDLGKVRAVASVAHKIDDYTFGLDDEPAPKTAVPIVQSARGEMLRGNIGYPCARKFGALPPIEFDRRPDARFQEVTCIAKTGCRTRRPACSHLTQCRQIHVIVMVVRD